MGTNETYFLSRPWRGQTLVVGVLGFVFFSGMAALLVIPNLKDTSFVEILVWIFFPLLGLELIYQGLRSRIEVSETEIIYYQPRFSLACKWDDFEGLLITGYGIAFKFSEAEILSGRIIAHSLRSLGPWHRTIPISAYTSVENKARIREIVYQHRHKLSDDDKITLTKYLET